MIKSLFIAAALLMAPLTQSIGATESPPLTGLQLLEAQLHEELDFLEYPTAAWVNPSRDGVYDVAIIGGGMGGLTVAFALMREGITNLQVFDSNPAGLEGPWMTYARMPTLRSPKGLAGLALGLPKLTFRAWYTAQYGENSWENLYKIPTPLWMDYLCWYKKVLMISVKNQCAICSIEPIGSLLQLSAANGEKFLARKVILATGRSGFGGEQLPACTASLPKELYAHTCERIDFELLKGKNVGILGLGASAFDAATYALEGGSASVTILGRRSEIPYINKFSAIADIGFTYGYFHLADRDKINIIRNTLEQGTPPPIEALERLRKYPNFKVITRVGIKTINENKGNKGGIFLTTEDDTHFFDFLICATGFAIDGSKQPELKAFFDSIQLWGDLEPNIESSLAGYPHLGEHFEFREKVPGSAPYLKNIHCFNYAATLSHGLTSSTISDISVGALKLSKGIASDFFQDYLQEYLQRLQTYEQPEFVPGNYPFILYHPPSKWLYNSPELFSLGCYAPRWEHSK